MAHKVDLASNRIDYQGCLLGGKGGRYEELTTFATFMCLFARNCGSLNLLDPPGPVQTCNGISLFLFHYPE